MTEPTIQHAKGMPADQGIWYTLGLRPRPFFGSLAKAKNILDIVVWRGQEGARSSDRSVGQVTEPSYSDDH